MNHLIDQVFSMQDHEILECLLAFEKNEEFLQSFIFLISTDENSDEESPQSCQIQQTSRSIAQVKEDEEEEYFDCTENFTETDRIVPEGEELEHWRDLLDLEEYQDAPENVQEILEITLGEQRRLPNVFN